MNDSALIGRQFTEGEGEFLAEGVRIRIGGTLELAGDFRGEFIDDAAFAGVAADEVDGLIVRETEEESAIIANAREVLGLPGELDEEFLEDVFGVRLAPGEVQEKGMQRPGVLVIKPLDALQIRHAHLADVDTRKVCLTTVRNFFWNGARVSDPQQFS